MKKDAQFWKLYAIIKGLPPVSVIAEAKRVNGKIEYYDERYVLICKLLKRQLVPSVTQIEEDCLVDDLRITHLEPDWLCSDRTFTEARVVVRNGVVISGHGWVSMAKERNITTLRCIQG